MVGEESLHGRLIAWYKANPINLQVVKGGGIGYSALDDICLCAAEAKEVKISSNIFIAPIGGQKILDLDELNKYRDRTIEFTIDGGFSVTSRNHLRAKELPHGFFSGLFGSYFINFPTFSVVEESKRPAVYNCDICGTKRELEINVKEDVFVHVYPFESIPEGFNYTGKSWKALKKEILTRQGQS